MSNNQGKGCLYYIFVFPFMLIWYLFTWPFYLIASILNRNGKSQNQYNNMRSYYNPGYGGYPQYYPPYSPNVAGHQFEYICADILRRDGFVNVIVTPGSGDQGADILAWRNGYKYAIQCKFYSKPVGNSAVQEVYAAKAMYDCHVAAVMTNSTFTPGAVQLAQKTGVQLWGNVRI